MFVMVSFIARFVVRSFWIEKDQNFAQAQHFSDTVGFGVTLIPMKWCVHFFVTFFIFSLCLPMRQAKRLNSRTSKTRRKLAIASEPHASKFSTLLKYVHEDTVQVLLPSYPI